MKANTEMYYMNLENRRREALYQFAAECCRWTEKEMKNEKEYFIVDID